jgi:methylated-DNA-[protein]-cysteine S-methyltransferase
MYNVMYQMDPVLNHSLIGGVYSMSAYFYETEYGNFGIAEHEGTITHLFFEEDRLPNELEIHETPLIREAAAQLRRYLSGDATPFSLPLAPSGTPFFRKAWDYLSHIPYGTTVSYKEAAARIGSPGGARAIGQANHRNPIPIFIPCHRVIGATGLLTGYRGGMMLKKQLIEMEQGIRQLTVLP